MQKRPEEDGPQGSAGEGSALDPVALARQIDQGYERLTAANRSFAEATRRLDEYEREVRQKNAEVLLETKNARSEAIYLEGLLDTGEHRRLVEEKSRTDLELHDARAGVDRLKLLVRLLEAASPGRG